MPRLRCGAVSIAKVGSFACLLEYKAFMKVRTSHSLQTDDFGDSIECFVLILQMLVEPRSFADRIAPHRRGVISSLFRLCLFQLNHFRATLLLKSPVVAMAERRKTAYVTGKKFKHYHHGHRLSSTGGASGIGRALIEILVVRGYVHHYFVTCFYDAAYHAWCLYLLLLHSSSGQL